jgi:hypothetical protein
VHSAAFRKYSFQVQFLLLLAGSATVSVLSPPPPSPSPTPANEVLAVIVPAGGITQGQNLTVQLNFTSNGSPLANQTVTLAVALPNGTVVQQLNVTTGADGTAGVVVPTGQLPVGVNVTLTATAASPSGAGNVTGAAAVLVAQLKAWLAQAHLLCLQIVQSSSCLAYAAADGNYMCS